MNPIIWRKGICDPHIHVFEGKAYLYATHDAPGYENDFHMDDWQIWSSKNLIDWQQEAVVYPEHFYCGALNQCWAVDAAYKNGKYYLYFSTGDWGIGVGVSNHPAGPFEDVLGKALVDYRDYPEGIPKWDPCVFVEDDGSAYIIAGTCKQEAPWDCYLIARLEEDMIHLAEPMRRLEYMGNPWPEDKASIHKYKDKYYLTHSSYYAVADQIYGPYEYRGNTGCNIDHGSFFTYQNQTYFASGGMDNPNRYLRSSFLAPCHYTKNGDIVIPQKIMEYGSGQYDSTWERIEASWYFAASRECKVENGEGVFLTRLLAGDALYFPEVSNINENAAIQFMASAADKSVITIHEDSADGAVLGQCEIGIEKKLYEDKLICQAGKKSLYLVADKATELHWFSFPSDKKRCTIEPVFSIVGRGASIDFDQNAANHQVLRNMELRGAFIKALADGGKGGAGKLTVPYYCTEKDVQLSVYVNQEFQGILDFPVTASSRIKKTPDISQIDVTLQPGLNQVLLYSSEYQTGRLAVDHILVESPKTNCGVYAAANGILEPKGNGCWDGFPQRESDPGAFSGRVVKYLEKPGDGIKIEQIDGGEGGEYLLRIHYSRGEKGCSAYQLLVNDNDCGILCFNFTDAYSAKAMETYDVKIELNAVFNTLTLRKAGQTDKGIFVDAFAITPLNWEKDEE